MTWKCKYCSTEVDDDNIITCYNCGKHTYIEERNDSIIQPDIAEPLKVKKTVQYEIIRGTLATWHNLAAHAASFIERIGPDRIISVSHSEDKDDGVIIIFYTSS